jgi:AMP-binding enzyme
MAKPSYLSEVATYDGVHSQELYELLRSSWNSDTPLVLTPPHLKVRPDLHQIKCPPEMILGVFTSGTSTGVPRLIVYSKQNIISSLQSIMKLFDFKKVDQIFSYPQPNHIFGLVLGYLNSILHEIPLVFLPGLYSQQSHQLWLERLTPGTLTLGTPVHFYDLIQFIKKNDLKPERSYSSVVGGACVSIQLWKDQQQILSIESPSVGFGASEASPGITHLPPGIEPLADGDIGYLLEGVHMGEITSEGFYFSGINACLGYVENSKFISQKNYLIKDHLSVISSVLAKDELSSVQNRFFTFGRSDLVLNRGGLKYSLEIMEAFLANENIKSLFLAIEDQRLGQEAAILIESTQLKNPEHNILRTTVIDLIFNRFGLKVNPDFIFFDQLPLNANLKIDRKMALKKIIKHINYPLPISTAKLIQFLPHRGSAVWVDEIVDFKSRYGRGRVLISANKFFMSEQGVRPSALIEFVAQTYGYSVVLDDIFNGVSVPVSQNTYIAEARDVKFYNIEILHQILNLSPEERFLEVEAECTHDFVKIKMVRGAVFFKNEKIADLNMKVAVF